MTELTAYKHTTEDKYVLVAAGTPPPTALRNQYNAFAYKTYDLADAHDTTKVPFDADAARAAIEADGYFISPGIVRHHTQPDFVDPHSVPMPKKL